MRVNYGVKTVFDSEFGSSNKTYLVKSHPNPTLELDAKNILRANEASSL